MSNMVPCFRTLHLLARSGSLESIGTALRRPSWHQTGTVGTVVSTLGSVILQGWHLRMGFIIAASATLIGLVLVLLKLTRHFATPQDLPFTAGWIDTLSIDRYRPMLRLLDEPDGRTQPGLTPKMAAKLRIQRCQIIRAYLDSVNDDFKQVCMAIKVLMVQSKRDRPDLASVLVRSQIKFASAVLMVQLHLVWYRYVSHRFPSW